MALRGTLKDFGIADILQLIGHQQKTGLLTLKNRDQTVTIYFKDGSITRAESSTREHRDLLGRMLVRAELLSEDQLNRALDQQKRTAKRLGQLLVESGAIDRKALATFTRLQTSETAYRLFLWEAGSYQFTQQDVSPEPDIDPIRSESVLMEGFRQVDEWPAIRRKVTGYGLVYDKLKDLDAMAGTPAADDDFDVSFDEGGGGQDKSLRSIGQNERIIYQLIGPGRDVQKIIDLSRLGEFETCKALANLTDAAVIAARADTNDKTPSAMATVGGIYVAKGARWLRLGTRVVVTATVLGAVAWGVQSPVARRLAWLQSPPHWGFANTSAQLYLGAAYVHDIKRALGVYRAVFGRYPEQLDDLVKQGLLSRDALRFPWRESYTYAAKGESYELVLPLY